MAAVSVSATVAPSGKVLFLESDQPILAVRDKAVIKLSVGGASGGYRLRWDGEPTRLIPAASGPDVVQDAVDGLLGKGVAAVSGDASEMAISFSEGGTIGLPRVNVSSLSDAGEAPPVYKTGMPWSETLFSDSPRFSAPGWDNSGQGYLSSAGLPAASWVFPNIEPGLYGVYSRWLNVSNGDPLATYRVYDGETYRGKFTKNHGDIPYSDALALPRLEHCGAFEIKSGRMIVTLDAGRNGYRSVADVIHIESRATGSAQVIGVTETGGQSRRFQDWTPYGDYRFRPSRSGVIGSFLFNGVPPGDVVFAATWEPNENRDPTVTYTIRDCQTGRILSDSVTVSQKEGPSPSVVLMRDWAMVNHHAVGSIKGWRGGPVWLEISGSGKGFVVADKAAAVSLSIAAYREPVSAKASYEFAGGLPSIEVNGVKLPSTGMLWVNPSDGAEPINYAAMPLSAPISPSSNVRVTLAAGALATSRGSNGPVSVQARNVVGGVLAAVDSGRRVAVGANLGWMQSHGPIVYANLMKMAGEWLLPVPLDANGYPEFHEAGNTWCVVRDSGDNIADTRGYPSYPAGVYVLTYRATGDGEVRLTAMGHTKIAAISINNLDDGTVRRVYRVSEGEDSPVYTSGIACQVIANAPGFHPAEINLRILDAEGKFHGPMVDYFRGLACIRPMQAVGTNSSRFTTASSLPRQTWRSYAANDGRGVSGVRAVKAYPYKDDTGYLDASKILVEFETDNPHGLVTGEPVTLNPSPWNASLRLNTVSGRGVEFTGWTFCPLVTGSRSFAVAIEPSGGNRDSLDGPQAILAVLAQANPAIPFEDAIDLAVECGHKTAWVNVPHAADDGMVKAMASVCRGRLVPGTKIIVELSNEPWNFAPGYAQFHHFRGLGKGNVAAGYAIRAKQVHDLFAQELGPDREADLVRYFNAMASVPSFASSMVEAVGEAAIDAIGPAVYTGAWPGSTAANDAMARSLDADQCVDLLERYVAGGYAAKFVANHKAISPTAKIVCYEGGLANGGAANGGITLARQSQSVSNHPRMAHVTRLYLDGLSKAGADVFAWYAYNHDFGSEFSANSSTYGLVNSHSPVPVGHDVLPEIAGVPPGSADLRTAPSYRALSLSSWNAGQNEPDDTVKTNG